MVLCKSACNTNCFMSNLTLFFFILISRYWMHKFIQMILNSYKWLQIDWQQRLGSWMCTACTVINSIYYSSQCRTSSVFRGVWHAAVHPTPPPLRNVRTIFWRDTLLKMGFQTYIFGSNVPSKCRKCRFRDPKFKKFPGGHAPGLLYNFNLSSPWPPPL